MDTLVKVLTLAVAIALLPGCGTTGRGGEDTAGSQPSSGDMGASTQRGTAPTISPVTDGGGFKGDPLDDPSGVLANRVVYFDFDSSAISDQDRRLLDAHAGYLAAHSRVTVSLEGHADERGSREYNIGLGDRRASAVRQYLLLKGVSSRQLTTVSYGEERPAALGHDEAAWKLNRRVELAYRR